MMYKDVIFKGLNYILNRKCPFKSIEKCYVAAPKLQDVLYKMILTKMSWIYGNVDNINSTVLGDKRNEDSISLDLVVEPEVSSVILQLKNSSICEADGIEITPVKRVVLLIAPAIPHIFNISLPTSVFSKRMQIAMDVIFHKKVETKWEIADLFQYVQCFF